MGVASVCARVVLITDIGFRLILSFLSLPPVQVRPRAALKGEEERGAAQKGFPNASMLLHACTIFFFHFFFHLHPFLLFFALLTRDNSISSQTKGFYSETLLPRISTTFKDSRENCTDFKRQLSLTVNLMRHGEETVPESDLALDLHIHAGAAPPSPPGT
ncbi:hypothetical protein E2C01_077260 [Portunus trituberculatus]|uniref:Uncharacterized protein n=1 Tax=Portunus trituberculatus TaxID=210409 RepID=A0A5B7ILK1_PORTR|nr:hypothetical protein [Portunus trituberculatus]